MDSKIQALFEGRANIIKSLAHPTRLFIVEELSRQEKCVSELTEMIGADISTVSKHLLVLKNANVVLSEKRGGRVYYSLRYSCILKFFSCIESVLRTTAEKQLV
jgi:ArsR family transcriptional regulator